VSRCPKCNTLIVYAAGDGKLKIRTRMLAITKSRIEVVCRHCGADVPLDLTIGDKLLKALEDQPPRLVIRKALDQKVPCS